MEKIVKVLKETKGVSDYRIVETKTESCELFYVLDKLETNRATNIEEIVRQVKDCYCVDVSTGVESDGVKDERKIKTFIEMVRQIGG